jgi:hypothetical protein
MRPELFKQLTWRGWAVLGALGYFTVKAFSDSTQKGTPTDIAGWVNLAEGSVQSGAAQAASYVPVYGGMISAVISPDGTTGTVNLDLARQRIQHAQGDLNDAAAALGIPQGAPGHG